MIKLDPVVRTARHRKLCLAGVGRGRYRGGVGWDRNAGGEKKYSSTVSRWRPGVRLMEINAASGTGAYAAPIRHCCGQHVADTTQLHMTITAAGLDGFCLRLRRQLPAPADALQALTAVQSFLHAAAAAELHAAAMQPLRDCLERHLEAVRSELLGQQACAIGAALQARDIERIAATYRRLSRNGFCQAAERGLAQLGTALCRQGYVWLDDWLAQTRRRIQGAYPDSVDYAAAGIDPAAHLAAEDLYAVLSVQVPDHARAEFKLPRGIRP